MGDIPDGLPMNSARFEPDPVTKLSVLVPVYNEIGTLPVLLDRVLAANVPCALELVVVDDGSTDGSREFLTSFAAQHPETRVIFHEHNLGKGGAIRTAIEAMTGDWAIIQDADLEYDPGQYAALLKPAQLGIADAVFGSRFAMGEYRRALYFWHTFANKALTLWTDLLTGLNLTDMETCYKLVRADILRNLTLRSKGFDIEPELCVKLARWGARIYEVPISYSGRTYAEGKKIGTRDAIQAFFALARYRFFDPHYCKHDGFLILQAVQRAPRFNRWMFGQFAPYLGNEVLEAGCGIGNLSQYALGRKRLVSIDIDPFYVDRMKKQYGQLSNVTILNADITRADDMRHAAEKGQFDGAFCSNVLEHLDDDVGALRNLKSALKPGGKLVVLVPNDPALYSGLDKTLGHCRRYTTETLTEAMREAGFNVERCWGFNRAGGLGWRLSKLLGRTTLSTHQMRVFEWLMPLVRLAETVPFHGHNSVIAVGVNPRDGAGPHHHPVRVQSGVGAPVSP
jgi:glycosyltransferase involved in cell wall biosynthesis